MPLQISNAYLAFQRDRARASHCWGEPSADSCGRTSSLALGLHHLGHVWLLSFASLTSLEFSVQLSASCLVPAITYLGCFQCNLDVTSQVQIDTTEQFALPN